MLSPFPGMDPYLEDHWRDVHASLGVYIRDALQDALPASLRARVEERVIMELPQGLSEEERYPDVRIVEYRPEPGPRQAAGVTVAEPMRLAASVEPLTEPYIEIIDISSGIRCSSIAACVSTCEKIAAPSKLLRSTAKEQHSRHCWR